MQESNLQTGLDVITKQLNHLDPEKPHLIVVSSTVTHRQLRGIRVDLAVEDVFL